MNTENSNIEKVSGDKLKVIFIPRRSRIRPYKMAKSLKYTKKVYLILLCEESFFDEELYEGIFDEVHFFTRRNILFKIPKAEKIYRKINERIGFGFAKMLRIINSIQPDIVHCFAEPYNHIEYVLKHSDYPVIMSDGADFTGISKGIENLDKRTLNQEKYCFEHVSGLVYKGPKKVGEYYRSFGINISSQELSWFDHIDEDLMIETTNYIRDNNELHFVYTGNISIDPDKSYCYYIPLAKILANQKIHFHVYPNPWQYHGAAEYRKLAEEEEYFHFHQALPLKDLIQEISNYDFGLWIHSEILSNRTSEAKMETGIGNKLFTYLESGLPVIVSQSRLFGATLVKDNGIGFVINDAEWLRLYEKANEFDIEKFRNSLNNFRDNYSLCNNGKRLLNHYTEIKNE